MPPLDSSPGHDPNGDVPRESARAILFQFVIFPLGVVLIGVAIFLLFGKLATSDEDIPDYLNEIRSGGSHERWQAAYQLSKAIKRGEAKQHPELVAQVSSLFNDAKNDDPRVRRYLAMVLGSLGDRKATPVLTGALRDADVETKIYILLALGELRDASALPEMLGSAASDEKDIRKAAVYAFGELGDPRAVPALAAALADPVPDVRFNAALALSRFSDPRAVGVLREMLDRERLAQVEGMREEQKEAAILAAIPPYAKLAGDEAKPVLQTLAKNDPSLRVRSAAQEAAK